MTGECGSPSACASTNRARSSGSASSVEPDELVPTIEARLQFRALPP